MMLNLHTMSHKGSGDRVNVVALLLRCKQHLKTLIPALTQVSVRKSRKIKELRKHMMCMYSCTAKGSCRSNSRILGERTTGGGPHEPPDMSAKA